MLMSKSGKTNGINKNPGSLTHKLMVNGFICSDQSCALSVEVRRGMAIRTEDGLEAGMVAAVVLEGGSLRATHVLLSRLPETSGYWMIPVELVAEVGGEVVRLSISEKEIENLARWHSS
jgi:hypothetical protein